MRRLQLLLLANNWRTYVKHFLFARVWTIQGWHRRTSCDPVTPILSKLRSQNASLGSSGHCNSWLCHCHKPSTWSGNFRQVWRVAAVFPSMIPVILMFPQMSKLQISPDRCKEAMLDAFTEGTLGWIHDWQTGMVWWRFNGFLCNITICSRWIIEINRPFVIAMLSCRRVNVQMKRFVINTVELFFWVDGFNYVWFSTIFRRMTSKDFFFKSETNQMYDHNALAIYIYIFIDI